MTLELGGYGIYVWPAYGLAALVLLGLLAASLGGMISAERALDRLQDARALRNPARDPLAAEDGRGDGG